jgi:predicted nucleic acid-binding protein
LFGAHSGWVIDVKDKHLERATNLITMMPEHALRILDALHLAIAQHHGLDCIETADTLFAKAVKAVGFSVDFLVEVRCSAYLIL